MNVGQNNLFKRAKELNLLAPETIVFGPGEASQIGEIARSYVVPGPVVLVTGGTSSRATGLPDLLSTSLRYAEFTIGATLPVGKEPTVTMIDAMAQPVREPAPVMIVGVGGGSVLDAGKALSALATNPGSVRDYLEGVGRGFTVDTAPLPYVAVATTSGTGAEMTKNAVIADSEQGFKKSMRDTRMVPTAAIIDPELVRTVPRAVTAASGMDAITQLIEPCISTKRQPGPRELAGMALRGTHEALAACYRSGTDIQARTIMAQASGISGICLANSGLALAHGIASGLGGLHPVPHGLICGILLPHTLRMNRDACVAELEEALRNFLFEEEVTTTTIDRGINAIEALKNETDMPDTLAFLQLSDKQIREVAEASMGSSMTGNPVPMPPESTYAFLKPLC